MPLGDDGSVITVFHHIHIHTIYGGAVSIIAKYKMKTGDDSTERMHKTVKRLDVFTIAIFGRNRGSMASLGFREKTPLSRTCAQTLP